MTRSRPRARPDVATDGGIGGVGGAHLSAVDAALRGLLELAALLALGYWGWTTHVGLAAAAWAVGLPLLAAVLWGTFRVPGDPGDASVAIPGPVRLALELALFGGAAGLLADAGRPAIAGGLAAAVALHYLTTRDRVRWLLGG